MSKLVTTLASPHKQFVTKAALTQVNLSTTTGDMGILANHVPTIVELRPSVVTLIGDSTVSYFVPCGFATIDDASNLNITAPEVIPLDDIDYAANKVALDKAIASLPGAENKDELNLVIALHQAVDASKKIS